MRFSENSRFENHQLFSVFRGNTKIYQNKPAWPFRLSIPKNRNGYFSPNRIFARSSDIFLTGVLSTLLKTTIKDLSSG